MTEQEAQKIRLVTAKLRHAYENLVMFCVNDPVQFADGLLSPAIQMLENLVMTAEQEAELRALARETYEKVCIGRPHMPRPDSDEGQRKIDRLYDISIRKGESA